MTTTNQGLNFTEIEQIVVMRVASAIETIAIYKARTHMARDSRNKVKRQEDKVTENPNKKREWEGNHSGSASHKQSKGHKVSGAHTVRPSNRNVNDRVEFRGADTLYLVLWIQRIDQE
ncbi:hypothetical protein Tco_0012580 [Tanacetum coccineum]